MFKSCYIPIFIVYCLILRTLMLPFFLLSQHVSPFPVLKSECLLGGPSHLVTKKPIAKIRKSRGSPCITGRSHDITGLASCGIINWLLTSYLCGILQVVTRAQVAPRCAACCRAWHLNCRRPCNSTRPRARRSWTGDGCWVGL